MVIISGYLVNLICNSARETTSVLWLALGQQGSALNILIVKSNETRQIAINLAYLQSSARYYNAIV